MSDRDFFYGDGALPFPVPEVAEDGLPYSVWDGVTTCYDYWAGWNVPSKSSTQVITVVGHGSGYQLGPFSLEQVCELYWRWAGVSLVIPVSASVIVPDVVVPYGSDPSGTRPSYTVPGWSVIGAGDKIFTGTRANWDLSGTTSTAKHVPDLVVPFSAPGVDALISTFTNPNWSTTGTPQSYLLDHLNVASWNPFMVTNSLLDWPNWVVQRGSGGDKYWIATEAVRLGFGLYFATGHRWSFSNDMKHFVADFSATADNNYNYAKTTDFGLTIKFSSGDTHVPIRVQELFEANMSPWMLSATMGNPVLKPNGCFTYGGLYDPATGLPV